MAKKFSLGLFILFFIISCDNSKSDRIGELQKQIKDIEILAKKKKQKTWAQKLKNHTEKKDKKSLKKASKKLHIDGVDLNSPEEVARAKARKPIKKPDPYAKIKLPSKLKLNSSKIKGHTACIMCHFSETNAWKKTHHFKTFRTIKRKALTRKIIRNMGIQAPTQMPSQCVSCHYTMQTKNGITRAISGVSCESCHGASADWIRLHSLAKIPRKQRIARSKAKGMLGTSDLYAAIQNCYQCHVAFSEKLVGLV